MSRTKIKTKLYDSANYLDTPEARAAYMTEALASSKACVLRGSVMASIAERSFPITASMPLRSISGSTTAKRSLM